ncbi:sce7726 family protein [Desulfuribacillus alkaliarsenatis]|uniref:Sce7726 family protein n=1 Tax=Desulfuribacillus alkaliarsenatis TaxID=766136 RepID=A0A1E5G455_9FIRM|nr:sce7726 family protein [Desulfuribacillus alkaliarsenatis]OEF97871.1 hypothetical protein BHF68_13680 [Desulfuribacillus alkaliarsenatis]
MYTSNHLILNRVFTRSTLLELIEKQAEETYASAIKRYINDPDIKNNGQLISEIYKELSKNYRNEYFYKNTLLNKLLLGVHSPRTTTALTEVSVSKSKADFILINGKAIVYEIKTELDNFERLKSQVDDYYKAFNYVSVVTSESNYKTIKQMLSGSQVGIYLLTKRNTLSKKKQPMMDNSQLDLNIIFKILRKSEYENIILTYYGHLPTVSQFNYYNTCTEMFCKIDTMVAYELFIQELKKRGSIDLDMYNEIPYELKFLTYFMNMRKTDYRKLKVFLKSKFGG